MDKAASRHRKKKLHYGMFKQKAVSMKSTESMTK